MLCERHFALDRSGELLSNRSLLKKVIVVVLMRPIGMGYRRIYILLPFQRFSLTAAICGFGSFNGLARQKKYLIRLPDQANSKFNEPITF